MHYKEGTKELLFLVVVDVLVDLLLVYFLGIDFFAKDLTDDFRIGFVLYQCVFVSCWGDIESLDPPYAHFSLGVHQRKRTLW